MKEKFQSGEYRSKEEAVPLEAPSELRFAPRLRVALRETQMYCAPTTAGIYDADATSTRINRNTCSAAHAQEAIQILAAWPGGMMLARTATSWGFVPSDAALSEEIVGAVAQHYVRGPWAVLRSQGLQLGQIPSLPNHAALPFVSGSDGPVYIAMNNQIVQRTIPTNTYVASTRPFTRRAVLEEVLSHVGQPYGFGGLDGGIDCSRLQLDVFGAFGIKLPRFSGWQAQAGT